MPVTRRLMAQTGALAIAATLLSANSTLGQSGDETAVNQAVEAMRKAMVEADKAKLEELVADQLSYGHSAGVVENKEQF